MRIYIAGPMTGLPDLNFPAFDKARDKLLKEGHRVFSPADIERRRSSCSYEEKLREDLRYLIDCDAIYLLRGWQKSKGALIERFVAQSIGLQVMFEIRE